MIAIIRITGQVDLNSDIKETLERLKIHRKYACVVLKPTKENIGMVKKVKDFVAYGDIDEKTLSELIEKRGKSIDKKKKLDVSKIVEEFKKGKRFEELGMKPFFRLHPARKGIETKRQYPKGVLGDHKNQIKELIVRML